jgi:hypothetical protein
MLALKMFDKVGSQTDSTSVGCRATVVFFDEWDASLASRLCSAAATRKCKQKSSHQRCDSHRGPLNDDEKEALGNNG